MINLLRNTLLILTLFMPAISTAGYYRIINIQEDTRKVYRNEPREVCEYDRSRNQRLGNAIMGAVIGNQFGSGNGRRAATIGGAVIGYNYDKSIQRCHTEYVRTIRYITYGYIVYYDYYGSLKSTYVTEYPRSYDIYIPHY